MSDSAELSEIDGRDTSERHSISMATPQHRPKVLAVWTREHATTAMAGRDKFVSALKFSLGDLPCRQLVVTNRLQHGRWMGLLSILADYLLGLITNKVTALQVLLYQSQSELKRFRSALSEFRPEVVLIDTVRLNAYAQEARKLMPDVKLVVDMDDLMSRRYEALSRLSISLNLGIIKRFVPPILTRLIARLGLARRLYKAEAHGLRAVEGKLAAIADEVIFASKHEAELFRQEYVRSDRPSVNCVYPPVFVVCESIDAVRAPFRFIWVGSDVLTQNEQSIRYLLDLWKANNISTPLVVYGKMTKQWPTPPHVEFAGFELDTAKIYSPNSILLVPSFVQGGIKTKVLEAFGHGTPVIGTRAAFEGLSVDYPLCFSELGSMESLIANVGDRAEEIRRSQAIGHGFVKRHCALDVFRAQFLDILASAPQEYRPNIAAIS